MRQHIPHQVARYQPVLDTLVSNLYLPDLQRLMEERIALLEKQSNLTHIYAAAFVYGGQFYTNGQDMRNTSNVNKQAPHPDLLPEVLGHIRVLNMLEQEKVALRQGLVIALRRCNEDQDVRDMLPDFAVKLISWSHIPRTRPVGYLFEHSPGLAERYNKVIEKMQMLSIVKLFY